MIIVEPYVEVVTLTPNPLITVEACGRTCYKSTKPCPECGSETRNPACQGCVQTASDFVKKLVRRGHESVLEHASVTVRMLTDRGISHELVRHRIASYSQESTRFVDYNQLKVICPPFSTENSKYEWERAMSYIDEQYTKLRRSGEKPEIARAILPTCTATEIVVSANMRSWRHMFSQRLFNEKAHPQIRQLMRLVFDKFLDLGMETFISDLSEKDAK